MLVGQIEVTKRDQHEEEIGGRKEEIAGRKEGRNKTDRNVNP